MQKDSPSSLWRTSAAADALTWLHERGWFVDNDLIGEQWTIKARNGPASLTATGNTLAAALMEAVVQARTIAAQP